LSLIFSEPKVVLQLINVVLFGHVGCDPNFLVTTKTFTAKIKTPQTIVTLLSFHQRDPTTKQKNPIIHKIQNTIQLLQQFLAQEKWGAPTLCFQNGSTNQKSMVTYARWDDGRFFGHHGFRVSKSKLRHLLTPQDLQAKLPKSLLNQLQRVCSNKRTAACRVRYSAFS